jgi:hypothetical protein
MISCIAFVTLRVMQRAETREGGWPRTKIRAKEFLMNTTTHEPLNLNDEERALLEELLESASTKLLVEIRRTDHRVYRDELRHRLTLVEALRERCRHPRLPIEGEN